MYTGFGGFFICEFSDVFTVFYLAISLEFFENDCASGVCFACVSISYSAYALAEEYDCTSSLCCTFGSIIE